MIPQVPSKGLAVLQLPAPAREVANLRPGSTVQAIVLEVSGQDRVQLQIGTQSVTARTIFPLAEGQQLSLHVSRDGNLILLRPDTAGKSQPGQQAMREALPRQNGQAPLLANLTQLARPETTSQFSGRIIEAARALVSLFPLPETLSRPESLRQAIRDSGLFLEARLRQLASGATREVPVRDLKGALLRMAALLGREAASGLRPGSPAVQVQPLPPPTGEPAGQAVSRDATAAGAGNNSQSTNASSRADPALPQTLREMVAPPMRDSQPVAQPRVAATLALFDTAGGLRELQRQVDGVLARIELGQLASLPADDDGRAVWHFELPVRNGEERTGLIQMRIEGEGQKTGADADASGWQVSLAFDMEPLGPVQARIAVNGDAVSTLFVAEREHAVERLRRNLDDLDGRLLRHGLQTGSLCCRQGTVPRGRPQPAGPSAGDARVSDSRRKRLPSAVALRYPGRGAPRVTAKGHGEVAGKILKLAEENDIPLYKDAELAGLLSGVDLGAEIPEALYIAVAEVIAFAYRLAAEQSDVPVPPTVAAAPSERNG